jgi:hypothetical protein
VVAPFRWVRSPRDCIFDMVLTVRVREGPNLKWRSSLLTGCAYPALELSCDYVCSFGGLAVLDDDGIDPSTRVPIARRVWVIVAMSYHTRH